MGIQKPRYDQVYLPLQNFEHSPVRIEPTSFFSRHDSRWAQLPSSRDSRRYFFSLKGVDAERFGKGHRRKRRLRSFPSVYKVSRKPQAKYYCACAPYESGKTAPPGERLVAGTLSAL